MPLILVLILIASPSFAESPDSNQDPADARPAAARSELGAALRAVLTEEHARLEALRAEFDAATDEEAAIAVQRRIVELRRRTEIALLEVQLEHARKHGRTELAAAVERRLERLRERPRAAVSPAGRGGR